MTDIQPHDPLAAQLRGEEPHDHFALPVGDDPVSGLGIEPDRHLLTLIGFTNAFDSIVKRDQAVCGPHTGTRPLGPGRYPPGQVPQAGLVLDAVGSPRVQQLWVGLQARPTLDRVILLALGPGGPIHP